MAASDNVNPQQFSTWYHGTTPEKAESIRANGFEQRTLGYNPTLTSHPMRAGLFGSSKVTFHIPADQEDDYIQRAGKIDASLKQPLPAHMIHHVEHGG